MAITLPIKAAFDLDDNALEVSGAAIELLHAR
jgi:hypothetical protein